MKNRVALLLTFVLVSYQPIPTFAEQGRNAGLASKYLGDVGISCDNAVVFQEDCQERTISEMVSRWTDKWKTEDMSLVIDFVDPTINQNQCLRVSGEGSLFKALPRGYDRLYVRYYAKINSECKEIHHWPWLGGNLPVLPWPFPNAGVAPKGNDRFSTGVEPNGSKWKWDFYTYWVDMKCWGKGQRNECYGNSFLQNPTEVRKGVWTCIEFMVKMNAPNAFDGEQTFWINGEHNAHVTSLRWRTTDDLKITYFWLENYVDTDPGCTVDFDDIVIATKYIGPRNPKRPSEK